MSERLPDLEQLQEAGRLYAAGDDHAAEGVCRGIIEQDGRHFDALHLLGVLLTRQVRPDEAIPFLRRAAAERPDHELLLVNLGNALLAARHYEAALEVSHSNTGAALNNRGLAYRGLGQDEAAEQAFQAATGINGNYAPAWFNLATTLARIGRLEESLAASRIALRVAPVDTPPQRLADVINEIGRVLLALGRPEEALDECRGFLQRHADQKTVVWNMSLCLLLLGHFEEGWRAYEARFDVPEHDPRPQGAVVLDPAQVTGKRILIMTEQGRGDMLQFIRYAPLLADLGAVVCVQAYPDLVPLLAAMPGVSEVVSTSDKLPDVDICTPVMSLPLAFGSQPANVPYLRVPVDRTIKLEPCSRLRVGVAWSGSLQSYGRSAMPAKTMAPVLALPSYEFHCLQKEITETDLDWLDTNEAPIRLHTAYLKDFADTAALIDQMDVVMAIDTAVAHLAGALGKPVYILLPFNPDWRWMLGRSDSPWYPTARLYRQPDRGHWTPVVQAVIEDLRRI